MHRRFKTSEFTKCVYIVGGGGQCFMENELLRDIWLRDGA